MQPFLDGLQLDLPTAIKVAAIPTYLDGKREISSSAQRLVLRHVVNFKSRTCWQPAAEIAKQCDPSRFMDERTVRGAIKGLDALGLLTVTGPRSKQAKKFTEDNLQRLKELIPQSQDVCERPSVSGSTARIDLSATARYEAGTTARMLPGSSVRMLPGSTARHNTNESKENNGTTEVVVSSGSFENAIEAWTELDAKRIIEIVAACGVGLASDAIRKARFDVGLSVAEVEERVDEWRKLPLAEREASKLYNWLSTSWSYERHRRQPISVAARPRLTDDEIAARSLAHERERSEARKVAATEPGMADQLRAALAKGIA